MSTEVIVALIVAGGGGLTVLANYKVGSRQAKAEERKNSGDISSSDAASLWAESNTLRQEYKERAAALEKQLEDVNTKLQEVFKQLSDLQARQGKMTKKIAELKKLIVKLRAENTRLIEERKKGS